jgi:hypothetical protein
MDLENLIYKRWRFLDSRLRDKKSRYILLYVNF